jgi:hypothetical protein
MVMESRVCYASSHSHIILIDAGGTAVVILVQALSALFSRFHGINFRSGCLTKKPWMSYIPGMNKIFSLPQVQALDPRLHTIFARFLLPAWPKSL